MEYIDYDITIFRQKTIHTRLFTAYFFSRRTCDVQGTTDRSDMCGGRVCHVHLRGHQAQTQGGVVPQRGATEAQRHREGEDEGRRSHPGTEQRETRRDRYYHRQTGGG